MSGNNEGSLRRCTQGRPNQWAWSARALTCAKFSMFPTIKGKSQISAAPTISALDPRIALSGAKVSYKRTSLACVSQSQAPCYRSNLATIRVASCLPSVNLQFPYQDYKISRSMSLIKTKALLTALLPQSPMLTPSKIKAM